MELKTISVQIPENILCKNQSLLRYCIAVAQRPNRISQLSKLIETSYKEKAILGHQLTQLEQQKSDLEDKILSFENTLIYLKPNFDFRKIKTQFNASKLIKPRFLSKTFNYWLQGY